MGYLRKTRDFENSQRYWHYLIRNERTVINIIYKKYKQENYKNVHVILQ